MIAGTNEDTDNQVVNVLVDGKRLEQVRSFTYLGSRRDDSGKSEKKIRIKIGKPTSALAKLDNIWRAKDIHMKNKLMIRSVVIATLLYACES